MNKKRLILILAIVLPLLLIGGGLGIATRGFAQPLMLNISFGPTTAAAAPEPTPAKEEAPVVEEGHGVMLDLGSKVVNLADPGGYRYLRIGIVLELTPLDPEFYKLEGEKRTEEEKALREDVLARRALIDDALISCISDKAFGDIFTLAGKETLKDELRSLINERLGGEPLVSKVYFTDFVIN